MARTYYERTRQRIEDITADKGGLLVGIFNVEDQGGIEQDIKQVVDIDTLLGCSAIA